MKKFALKGLVSSIALAAMITGAQAETYEYSDFSPKYKADLNAEQAKTLEIQVKPSMTEYEKLGDFYRYDVKHKNLKKAYEYYRVAEREGSNYSAYMMAKMTLNGTGVSKNILDAREKLKKIDAPYERFASRLLAESYLETGETDLAKEHLKDVKTPEAIYQLAKMAQNKGHRELAINLYEKNIGNEHIQSYHELGKLHLKNKNLNTEKALSFLKKSAKEGYEEAQYLLGRLYLNGNDQMYAEHKEGLRWLLIAGQNGNDEALRKSYWLLTEAEKGDKYEIDPDPDLRQKLYEKLHDS